jgi:ferredoxin-type protein NapG
MAGEPQYGRRHFLKDSLASIAKTAQAYVAHRDAPPEKPAATPRENWLRPPGAVSETLFAERCTKCGDCLEACPYHAITPHATDGLPIIVAERAPCHLCEDLPCIASCRTDALLPLTRFDVKMGLAVVSPRLCTAEQGCNACVSRCPTGALSMDFGAMTVGVSGSQCVGCGLCEYTCKSVNDHVAITVRPARSLSIIHQSGQTPL